MTHPPVSPPTVSVVIPCRNEARYIGSVLDSIAANDFPKELLEVLVVDGRSDDDTRRVVSAYADRHPFIRLLDNPARVTPSALNVGVTSSRGQIIVRMDAHSTYPQTYISDLVFWLEKSRADNVGGVWLTLPGAATATAQAIALALSHPFGVGNAYYRIGASEPRWVDTVPFGCYRRQVFEEIGLFDEDLIRNQDDEFNHRLTRYGGRILLVPSIVSSYYARDRLGKLWRMNYQYGYFKPLATRKVGRPSSWRQLVPAAFVLSLFGSVLLALMMRPFFWLATVIAGAYLGVSLVVTLDQAYRHKALPAMLLLLVFPVLHVSYGVGFLLGALVFWVLKRSPGDKTRNMALSR